jgi:hypothetical protein
MPKLGQRIRVSKYIPPQITYYKEKINNLQWRNLADITLTK